MLDNFKQVGPERQIGYKRNPDNTETPFRYEYVNLESTSQANFLSNLQMTSSVLIIKTGKDLDWHVKDVILLGKEDRTRYIITNIETLRAGAEKISKSKYHFPIAEKLQELCKNGTISVIAFDECHKCFDYDTLIKTDLGELKIGDVVENEINCNVLSYNEITKTFEYKPIVNFWKNNTSNSKFIELTFEDDDGNEKKIKCTDDHLFLTKNRGWVMAKDLTEYDDFDL